MGERLRNRVAVVTGAGSGIGRAASEAFGREGARVVCGDIVGRAAEEAAAAIRASGGEATGVAVDVADETSVAALIQAAVDTFGGIDILFNNAGILRFGSVVTTKPDTWDRVMDVNLKSVYLCSRAAIPVMWTRGGGAIVNVSSSTGAHDAKENTAAYVASKGGVALLTKAMALDHAGENIRVNAIAPGPTNTAMLRENLPALEMEAFARSFPMGRLGEPRELADAVVWLASDEASFVTGAVIAVDGGQTAGV